MTNAPAHILVVEDEDGIREILGLVLESHGYRTHGVANGLEALEYLATHAPPSLILLDLMLPVMDGEELMERLRRNSDLRDIPVVIVSGHHDAMQKAVALRASGCLPKPVDIRDLLKTVEQYTSQQASAET